MKKYLILLLFLLVSNLLVAQASASTVEVDEVELIGKLSKHLAIIEFNMSRMFNVIPDEATISFMLDRLSDSSSGSSLSATIGFNYLKQFMSEEARQFMARQIADTISRLEAIRDSRFS